MAMPDVTYLSFNSDLIENIDLFGEWMIRHKQTDRQMIDENEWMDG